MSASFRSLVRTAAVFFAILFTLVAAGQYLYLRHQLQQATRGQLLDAAEDVRDAIAFRDKWDLEGYRRTSQLEGPYFVVTPTGTLIDIIGHPEDLLGRVSLPFHLDYDRPFRVTSDVGEDWVLYAHKLTDGLAVLGVRVAVLPEELERRFRTSAALFGNTTAEASRVPERKIDEALDYAVVDANGVIRSAVGGIPFKAARVQVPNSPTFSPARQVGNRLYATLIDPIVSKTGQRVGVITAFQEVTDSRRLLRQSAIFNGLAAAILWLTTVALGAAYLRRVRPSEIPCPRILMTDESDTAEFKASLRWDYRLEKTNPEVEKSVVKAVAGFLNSDRGGTLVIGVSDRKELLGLEADYKTFKSVKPDRDGFEQMLGSLLDRSFGARLRARWVRVRFCPLDNKEVCVVSVAPAPEPAYVQEEGKSIMYVRVGNATKPLDTREAVAYSSERWGPAFGRIWPSARRVAAPLGA